MPESLLSPSQIKMFGRPFAGLKLVQPTRGQVEPNPIKVPDNGKAVVAERGAAEQASAEQASSEQGGAEQGGSEQASSDHGSGEKNGSEQASTEQTATEQQDTEVDITLPAHSDPEPSASYDLLANQLIKPDSSLARIYGFTYEGRYYDLPQPAIFLVHGKGRAVSRSLAGALDKSGVLARDWVFEEDARYWEYDRVNYSLRIDMATGTLDDILLAACEAAGGAGSSRSTMASRSTVASRSDLSSRSDLAARSDMNTRFRMG